MKWQEITEALFYVLMGAILTIFIISSFGCATVEEKPCEKIEKTIPQQIMYA